MRVAGMPPSLLLANHLQAKQCASLRATQASALLRQTTQHGEFFNFLTWIGSLSPFLRHGGVGARPRSFRLALVGLGWLALRGLASPARAVCRGHAVPMRAVGLARARLFIRLQMSLDIYSSPSLAPSRQSNIMCLEPSSKSDLEKAMRIPLNTTESGLTSPP